MLLVDGVYLGFATYVTGGTQSPLWFLLFVHLVAVTLLASYRTGLKIALWHSLVTIVALYAQAAELIPARESAPGVVPDAGSGLGSLPVFNITAFWIVAIVTAAFSSLNERELRRRRADSEALATMATEMEELQRPPTSPTSCWTGSARASASAAASCSTATDGVTVLAARGAGRAAHPLPARSTGSSPRPGPGASRSSSRARSRANPALAALLPRARRLLVLPLYAESQLLGAVAIEHRAGRGRQIERRLVTVAAAARRLRGARAAQRPAARADPAHGRHRRADRAREPADVRRHARTASSSAPGATPAA